MPHKTHYHEASHFVFNVLIHNIEGAIPLPSYIEVSQEGSGLIDGGLYQHFNDEQSKRELEILKVVSQKCKKLEIARLLAGYTSYSVFVDEGKKQIELGDRNILNNRYSDIDKCNSIAGIITGEDDFCSHGQINSTNLELLKKIELAIIKIMGHDSVKKAIQHVAQTLEDNNNRGATKVDGNNIAQLIKQVRGLTKDIDISLIYSS